jgi:glycosyltransferase involved in cell wall biosynthesis
MKITSKTIIQVYGGSPKKRGSLEDYFLHLTARLNDEGFDSVFIFDQKIDPAFQALYTSVNAKIVLVPETPRRFDLQMISAFYRLFRRIKPVLVNFHFGRSCPNGLIAARLSGIRHTIWTKHSLNQDGPFYRKIAPHRLLLSMIYVQARLAKKLIAVSEGLKRELLLYSVPESKISHFYLGINLSRYRQGNTSSDLSAELSIPPGRRLIACISQARPEKGLEYLLQAMSSVCYRHPEAHLLIVGGGPLTGYLRDLGEKLGVADKVTFCGVRNDVERILSACEFSVLPSLTEGLGLVILESCACGKPVIASKVGGIPEIITEGVNGFLIQPRDVQAFAETMTLLLSDRDLLLRMGQAGIARAREFDLNLGVAKTLEVYRELISSDV